MKKQKLKFNALISLLLTFSMIMGQPAAIYAEEISDETITEEVSGEVTADDETQPGGGDYESVISPETNAETNDETENGDSNIEDPAVSGENDGISEDGQSPNDGTGNEGDQDEQQSEGDLPGTPDEGNTDLTDDTDIPDDTEEPQGDSVSDAEDENTVDTEDSEAVNAEEKGDVEAAAIDLENNKELDELGFKSMTLTSRMLDEKKDLVTVLTAIKSMDAGEDYIDKEVVYIADSENEAREIAECYGGTLLRYDYGVATASIEQNVQDAVRVAADMSISIPAVYPNIIYKLDTADVETDHSSSEASDVDMELTAGDEELQFVDTEDVEAETAEDEEELPYEVIGEENVYALSPTDPQYTTQWYHEAIHTVDAWDSSAKGKDVEVAVIDSGIDYNHPDLESNISGYISVYEGEDGKDDYGHGTHCAGIIAALENNLYGVGIAPEAKIYSIKALQDGLGSTEAIVKGMRAAVSRKVNVVNMSFGTYCYDALFQREINSAVNQGILLIAAAGNDATDQKSYPAAYNNVIAVAATGTSLDDNDNSYYLTDFSNYGSWVDIAAPGYNILSTLPTYKNNVGLNFGSASGTSMAAPVVSATAAVMLSNNSTLRNTRTKASVTKITKALIDGGEQYGAWGRYYYPFVDVEASAYAVDSSVPQMPTVHFSSGEPDSKGVVLAGVDEMITFDTTTDHGKIYFTINGKKPTSKTGHRYYKGTRLIMNTSGKIKIQAVTVLGNKTSKVFSKTYKFDVKATSLSSPYDDFKDGINVTIGKSIQLNVDVFPDYASNKKLEWTSSDATGMIKVNKSGKVTCKKGASPGLVAEITAKTKDGSDLEYKFTVTARNEKIEFLELNAKELKMSYWADVINMREPDQTSYVTGFQLKTMNSGVETKQYLYKSSNKNVAVVSEDGYITAYGKGKANITVTANDGSGLKAVCKVTVVTPVYSISASSSTGYAGGVVQSDGRTSTIPIGTGCSISMKTIINRNSKSWYCIPNNKKLQWTSDNPGMISVSKNGKVKCDKNATVGSVVNITVTAADGWGTYLSIPFVIVDKIEKMYYVDGGKRYPKMTFTGPVGAGQIDPLDDGKIVVETMHNTNVINSGVLISISNRDVVYRYYDSNLNSMLVVLTKPGTSKITYAARDGSNKKITLTYKVKARQLNL